MRDRGSIQQKVQALCDCFAETDVLSEMATVSREADGEEAALKWLALAVLHGIDQDAEEIKFYRSAEGKVNATIEYRKRELPIRDDMIGQEVMEALREMTQIEGKKAKARLALGIRDSSIEVQVKIKQEDDSEKMTIDFPK